MKRLKKTQERTFAPLSISRKYCRTRSIRL